MEFTNYKNCKIDPIDMNITVQAMRTNMFGFALRQDKTEERLDQIERMLKTQRISAMRKRGR